MTKYFLHILVLTLFFSCNLLKQDKQEHRSKTNSEGTQIKNNIRFDFTAERIDTLTNTIEINASLFNDNNESVYYITSSCEGQRYLLRFDSSQFDLSPWVHEALCYEYIASIPPKGQYNFQANFHLKTIATKIKLGFDFHEVVKPLDVQKTKNKVLNDSNRPQFEKYIIWTDEKQIE